MCVSVLMSVVCVFVWGDVVWCFQGARGVCVDLDERGVCFCSCGAWCVCVVLGVVVFLGRVECGLLLGGRGAWCSCVLFLGGVVCVDHEAWCVFLWGAWCADLDERGVFVDLDERGVCFCLGRRGVCVLFFGCVVCVDFCWTR